MDYNAFLEWLLTERKMSQRAARDVISRCRRVCKIIGCSSISQDSLEKLNSEGEFNEKSVFVKAQLRRALALWFSYKEVTS